MANTFTQIPPKNIPPNLLGLNTYRVTGDINDLKDCPYIHVHNFLMGKALETEEERSGFLKALFIYQIADWNGWAGWHPRILADFVWSTNVQRSWAIERHRFFHKSKKRMVTITPRDSFTGVYFQEEVQIMKEIKETDEKNDNDNDSNEKKYELVQV